MAAYFSVSLRLLVTLAVLSPVQSARAESAVFASSEARAAELAPELTLALRGHDILLVVRGLGDSRTALERAAAAQRIGRNIGSAAALWIESEPPLRVRAVGMSGERIYEAPLPAPLEIVDPRVFASVATSVLLEALGRTGSAPEIQPVEASPGPYREAIALPALSPELPVQRRSLPRQPRFFLRTGLTAALVHLGNGAHPDPGLNRATLNEVAQGARSAQGTVDLASVKAQLRAHGYDCQVDSTNSMQLAVSGCRLAVSVPGVVSVLAIDLATGARISDRLAVALTARIAPEAGRGVLAHALLGLQLEAALAKPRVTGLWLNALGGFGVGRIQAAPRTPQGRSKVYASSGLFDVRFGVQLGYRFTENYGLYTGPVVHLGFPDKLWAVDPSLGFEARL